MTITFSFKSFILLAFTIGNFINSMNVQVNAFCQPQKTSTSRYMNNMIGMKRGVRSTRNTFSQVASKIRLKMADEDNDFWEKQKSLASSLTAQMDYEEQSFKKREMEKFANRRLALVSETFFVSMLVFSICWFFSPSVAFPASYSFGSLLGTAYSFGLGKYVETIGGTNIEDLSSPEGAAGAGVGQARFAFLILLFIFIGKFQSQGLMPIPSIAGFFTYQLAALTYGLREIDD